MTSEELIDVIITTGLIFVAGYLFYRFWFDSSRFLQEYKLGVAKLPKWYPFRGFALHVLEKRYWLWFLRFVSTVFLFGEIATLVYILAD